MSRARKPARRFRPAVTPLEERTAPAVHTWTDQGFTNDWSDAGNWSGGVPTTNEAGGTVVVFNRTDFTTIQNIPGLVVDQLRFDADSQVTLTLNQNLGIATPFTIDTHIVDESGRNSIVGSGDLVLIDGLVVVRTKSPTGALTVGADITGTGGLIKVGAGVLTLTTANANTYTRSTLIHEGTLRLQTTTANAGLPSLVAVGGTTPSLPTALELFGATELSDTATVEVYSEGELRVFGSANEDFLTLDLRGGRVPISAGGNLTVLPNGRVLAGGPDPSSVVGPGTLTLSGGVTFDVLPHAAAQPQLLVTAPIAGSADLVKNGAGTLAIAGGNTFTGLTRINGGTLLAGTGADKVALTFANNVLAAEGSAGDDAFAFAANVFANGVFADNVVANGVLLRFGLVNGVGRTFVFRGNGGTDRADLYLSGIGNVVGLAATHGALTGNQNYSVFVGAGVETVTATARGPGNTAYLAGSEGADVLGATPAFATLSGAGFSNTVAGFETVGVFGNGGVDTAYLTGSAGADNFVATPTYAGMVGVGFANYVAGFEGVVAAGGGGSDAAFLADSEQADTIVAGGTRATLTLPTVTVVVDGFAGVIAYGFNGGVNRKQVGAVGFFLELPGVWVG